MSFLSQGQVQLESAVSYPLASSSDYSNVKSSSDDSSDDSSTGEDGSVKSVSDDSSDDAITDPTISASSPTWATGSIVICKLEAKSHAEKDEVSISMFYAMQTETG